MKVTVTKFLNVRVGSPSVNAPSYQYLAPGSELEVDGELYTGDSYDEINTWLKDEANNYYWSGGTNHSSTSDTTTAGSDEFDSSRYWWMTDYGIPNLWTSGLSGKGIKVAVLDSGISLPHKDLAIDSVQCTDVTESQSGIADKVGHGTHTTGVIKAINNGFGTTGIAYGCDFFFAKVSHDIVGDRVGYLTKGIEWAINAGVHILSLSIGFEANEPDLEKAIALAKEKQILVIAAAGNNPDLDNILYPAKYSNVLAIGACDQNRAPLQSTVNASQTDLFAPGDQILSTFLNNQNKTLSGSSQATPFVSAVAALLLEKAQKENKNITPLEAGKILVEAASKTDFGKIIDPLNSIKQL